MPLESINHNGTCWLRENHLLGAMSNVRELLEARRAAIDAEMEPLYKEHILRREKLLEIEQQLMKLQQERLQVEQLLKSVSEPSKPRITIMEAILETLSHKPQGMTAQEILTDLNANYFAGKLARHSLSPQLSRLKDRDRKIELQGDRWIRLPDQPSLFTRRPLKS
jgi:predicted transcriptional regulator